jgi:hypothetical protein
MYWIKYFKSAIRITIKSTCVLCKELKIVQLLERRLLIGAMGVVSLLKVALDRY